MREPGPSSPPRSFRDLFGGDPAVRALAHGRVNLVGEHTDYNDGFVLPTAIPQATRVELAPRADAVARIWSDGGGDDEPARYVVGEEARGRGWLDYVQGLTASLRAQGVVVPGFDARIDSDVPLGAGLSSSAALGIAVLRALRDAFGFALDDVALARLARRSENEFVGVPVGVMDPMACALADDGAALFLDTRSLEFERVPLSPDATLLVIESGLPHSHAANGYRQRRDECARAAAALGVASLRELSLDDVPRSMALADPLGRRVRHVLTENDRVLEAVAALRAGDVARLSRIFVASHASMRDDYEVSTPEIDALVAIASADPAVLGARLTGGGFGGSVVVLARPDGAAETARRVAAEYARSTGRTPSVLVPPTPDGA